MSLTEAQNSAVKLSRRSANEKMIVRYLCEQATASGFQIRGVDNGDGFDFADNVDDVIDAVFAVDEAAIRFKINTRRYTVLIVLGNCGWDCVSDCSVGNKETPEGVAWNELMDRVSAYSDTIEQTMGAI